MVPLNYLTGRPPAARHRPMNRPVLSIEIGRLACEEERVFIRYGEQAWRIQAADSDVAVCAARERRFIQRARPRWR